MARNPRSMLALILGLVMIGLGAYVALRPVWGAPPLAGSRLLDYAFAAFFILRGAMNLHTARRPPRTPGPGGVGPA